MHRLWSLLTDSITLKLLGVILIAAFLLIFLSAMNLPVGLAILAAVAILVIGIGWWFHRRAQARRASEALGDMLQTQAERAAQQATPNTRAQVEVLKKRLVDAIRTIRTSKLGQTSGDAALYELPWYMVIGNPAAGKTSAIVNSGLKFPFADGGNKEIRGIGGTRNCDWFFTTEGILLDTAGRYSVHEEDLVEWQGFLSLLKTHRPKAPINGIIIAASIAELSGSRPEGSIHLAKNLRQRIQELTDQLEIVAPVYVVFTKADLIGGFVEFFDRSDPAERERVWGATLPYDADAKADAVEHFDQNFDLLYEGLKELSTARMSMNRGQRLPPGLLTFPMEFAAIRPALRSFVATLFEENPFQFKPVFRGFYFSSALQEGFAAASSGERIAERFGLKLHRGGETAAVTSGTGFFLRDLFSRVIFADRNLVRQHASRSKLRLRYAAFFAAVAVFGLSLGAWAWSYIGNRQLVTNVAADLAKAARLQTDRIELQPRLEALDILQDRIEQLQQLRKDRPITLALGLYQGDALETKLRAEYYNGVREVMLKPVKQNLEAFLIDVNANAKELSAMTRPPQHPGARQAFATADPVESGTYRSASPASTEDGYNALKTYLMLGDRERVEAAHLNDQITRFWRGWLEANRGNMPREQMIGLAEKITTFYLANVGDPLFPVIGINLALVEQSRETLKRVVRGELAIDRVYREIKARAATRFPPMTVALLLNEKDQDVIAGSYAIAGTFTREAWEGNVEGAIRDAAYKELQSSDWVLKTAARDDLTLEGSPEQIQKKLTQTYKEEYVREWQTFLQRVNILEFPDFGQAVARLNRLGDPADSPINKLLTRIYLQTSWDNPSLVHEGLQKVQRGFMGWFKETVMRQAPSGVNVNVNLVAPKAEITMGPIGKEFAGLARLMAARGENKDASPMRGYLDALSKLRTRFNQIKNQGDTGPASRTLMQQTLDGTGSELADALRFVDEQMLTGMSDSQRAAIRPLLVRPLIQAYAVIVKPTEDEINKTWTAQVRDPFIQTIASKYPFDTASKIEASTSEIGQIFGPDGAVAKFVQSSMGPLVSRRGDRLTARTWAEMGIRLAPEFIANFPRWVAPLSAAGVAVAGAGAREAQKVFEIEPLPTSGIAEYTIDIDSQILRYRNTQPTWNTFRWPNAQGTPGASITAVTNDNREVEIFNERGAFGLERLISSAQRKRLPNGDFELSWGKDPLTVTINLRMVSSIQAASGDNFRGMTLPARVAGETPVTKVGAP